MVMSGELHDFPPPVETWMNRQTEHCPSDNFMPRADKSLSSKRQPLAEMLRSSLWAGGLTPKQLQRVEADVVELHFPIGAYVYRKGDSVESWPGVVSGLVKLASVSAAGKSVSFEGVTAGGWFGEGSLLKTEARTEVRIGGVPRLLFLGVGECHNAVEVERREGPQVGGGIS